MIPASLADATMHNGVSRRAKLRTCPSCGALIIVGLDADRCAGEARCDLRILTPAGEATALLTGRSTYRLRSIGRLELDRRSRWHIAGESASDVDVVADHVCGAAPLPAKPIEISEPSQEASDAIPY